MPEAPHAPSRALRPLIVVVAMVLVHATSAQGAQRHADPTLAEAARASLAEAADRMLQGTREIGLFALSLVGIDYRYGGESPERGLDCSGLIRYVFQHVTGVTLPRTAKELSRIGKDVSAPISSRATSCSSTPGASRSRTSGIYLGNDRFIHAPSRGGEVGVAIARQRVLAEALQRRAPARRRAARR